MNAVRLHCLKRVYKSSAQPYYKKKIFECIDSQKKNLVISNKKNLETNR